MNQGLSNISNSLKDPKQKLFIGIIGTVMVVMIGAGLYTMSKNKNKSQTPANVTVSKPDTKAGLPGQSDSPEFNKQIEKFNDNTTQEALEKNKTSMPIMTNKNANDFDFEKSIEDRQQKLNLDKKEPKLEEVKLPKIEPVDVCSNIIGVQESVPIDMELKYGECHKIIKDVCPNIEGVQQELPIDMAIDRENHCIKIVKEQPIVAQPPQIVYVQKKQEKKYTDEDAAIIGVLLDVQRNKVTNYEFDYARQMNQNANQNANVVNNGSVNNNVENYNGSQVTQDKRTLKMPIIKAGTILKAYLETGINSKEQSPILAKIMSGELKGTRLIGQFSKTGEKVVISFTKASFPKLEKSFPLNAIAIDPETQRTALASDVDHHYFLKYGALLGATFLQSYSQLLSTKNDTIIINPTTGAATTIKGPMTPKDINRAALGSVGGEIAGQIKQSGKIEPTITVDAGLPIGILVMDDIEVLE